MNKLFLFILSFCLSALFTQAQPAVSMAPSRLFYSFAQGQASTQDITIINPGKNAMVFSITLADWYRDSLGEKQYFKPNTLDQSCASWIELPFSSVLLQPGEEKVIPVKLVAPANAGNTVRNAMIFFTQAEDDESIRHQKKVGASMIIRLEVGVHVYYTPPALSKKEVDLIDFKDAGWQQVNDSTKHLLELVLKNKGEIMSESTVKLELTNQETAEEIKLEALPVPTLPGVKRIIRFNLPTSLKKGNYLAVAILDNGPDVPLRIGELEFKHSK